jgi:hypothetical protein
MKVKLQRTGGFANIPVNLDVDVDKAAADVATELKGLIDKVNFTQEKAPPAADVCNYELRIEDAGQERVLSANDMTLTEEASNLIDYLMQNFFN